LETISTLHLYSDSRLPRSQRALIAVIEKGIDLEIIHTDVFAGETKVNVANYTL
jgi:glutathione S-transferase